MFSEVFQMDKILGFCEKLWYVIGANLLFLLSNLPALLFFLFVGASQVRTCLPFFLLCMVPAGPALSALFYTMNRLLSKTETGYGETTGRHTGMTGDRNICWRQAICS